MEFTTREVTARNRIALIVHDHCKIALLKWIKENKALLRVAIVWDIPVATNRSAANFLINSTLFNQKTAITIPDYQRYLQKRVQ